MNDALGPLIARIRTHGPVNVPVSEEEYRLLRAAATRLWNDRSGVWATQEHEALVFLGFLRGYTFYRELQENERKFWTHFYDELNASYLGSVPEGLRDAVWTVLQGHPVTQPFCKFSGLGRELVGSIDRIWGIRSLSASRLVHLFCQYYEYGPGEWVDAELLRRLMPDADPVTLRQASAYNQVFHALVRVVDHLLDTDSSAAYWPATLLIDWLRKAEVDLGEPNVVAFLANKSDTALPEIIARVSGTPRRRFQLSARRTPRPISPASAASPIRIDLAPGVYEEGSMIVLDLQDHAARAGGSVKLHVAGRLVPQVGDRTLLPALPVGHHAVRLELNGAPTGVSFSVTVVPRLTWTPAQTDGPLFEGDWQSGMVRTEDGRFATFEWQPRWNDDGKTPVSTDLCVPLDETMSVPFTICAESLGARLMDVRNGSVYTEVNEPSLLEHLTVKPLPTRPGLPQVYRAFLESHAHEPVEVGPHGLAPLAGLGAAPRDRIVVEVHQNGEWARVHTVPYEPAGRLISVEVTASAVEIRGYAPLGSRLWVAEQDLHADTDRSLTLDVAGLFQVRRLYRLPNAGTVRELRVQLMAGNTVLDYQTHVVRPKEAAAKFWMQGGLGLPRVPLAVRTSGEDGSR